MHGAFLTLADQLRGLTEQGWTPNVILASSMMDVSAFAGAIREFLPEVPIATYFHESQFTYPLSPADRVDLTYQMKNWASAAVSNLAVFNSEFHRSVFFDEAHKFLNAFPEDKHTHLVDPVRGRSIVLPVGVDVRDLVDAPIERGDVPLIVWNQRWEHDKGPEELKGIVIELTNRQVEFRMAMCGEVFVSVPPTFAEITDILGDRLIQSGFAERSRYLEILREASVVLSTADQEFFGIGVVEAIAAGAWPVLPDRLVYPERVGELDIDPQASLYTSQSHAAELIAAGLNREPEPRTRQAALRYDWSVVAPAYDAALEDLARA
jgi:glycosyltransferase involved in cell wall biosynthesis